MTVEVTVEVDPPDPPEEDEMVTLPESELAILLESPEYEADIVGLPLLVSEYSTEQEPEERAHALLEGLNAPVPLEEVKETVPVGGGPPEIVGVTVAVHCVIDSAGTVGGKHDTAVEVGATSKDNIEGWPG